MVVGVVLVMVVLVKNLLMLVAWYWKSNKYVDNDDKIVKIISINYGRYW